MFIGLMKSLVYAEIYLIDGFTHVIYIMPEVLHEGKISAVFEDYSSLKGLQECTSTACASSGIPKLS